jgi:hypothetical protein
MEALEDSRCLRSAQAMIFENVFILRVASEPVKAVIERHMATHLAASLSTVIGAAIVWASSTSNII